jgi:hypothetical protein
MNYKVTLWKKSDYCDVAPESIQECTFFVEVDADTKYQAAEKALAGFKNYGTMSKFYDLTPRVYSIEVI